jgi:predicted neuraminidase
MIKKQPIFDQFPDRPMSHCATMVELPDDSIRAAWFSGSYEPAPDMTIFTARKQLLCEWSAPKILVNHPQYAVGQPVFYARPENELWLFFVMVCGDFHHPEDNPVSFDSLPPSEAWTSAQPFLQKSFDMGETWESPDQLLDYPGLMFRSRPLILKDRIIVPAYDENTWESRMLISEDNGLNWHLTESIQSPFGNIHAALVQLADGQILAYLRPGGKGGVIWRTISDDLGETWQSPTPTKIPNPNSGFDLIRLRSGNLLLAFNDSASKRTPLCVALAAENEHFSCKRIIESGSGEFSYPSLLQTKDHSIHIMYTYHRKNINYATFSEEWICSKFEGRTK